MKKSTAPRTAHTSNAKIGMGDYYGTAIKQKFGKVHESMVDVGKVNSKKLKKAPKSLA
jgi:hypothetical protein